MEFQKLHELVFSFSPNGSRCCKIWAITSLCVITFSLREMGGCFVSTADDINSIIEIMTRNVHHDTRHPQHVVLKCASHVEMCMFLAQYTQLPLSSKNMRGKNLQILRFAFCMRCVSTFLETGEVRPKQVSSCTQIFPVSATFCLRLWIFVGIFSFWAPHKMVFPLRAPRNPVTGRCITVAVRAELATTFRDHPTAGEEEANKG